MRSLLVGRAKKIITPDLGSELAGFAARKGTATAVHDDLYAGALVLSSEDCTVVLVSLDVIGVTKEFTDSVRRAVEKSRGITRENVLVCATHTHCGPVSLNHFFNPNQKLNSEFLAMARDRTVGAIEEAFDRREASTVRAGMVAVERIAVNRRNDSGKPVDEEAGVLVVEDTDGRVTSVLVNYACHPTVLGPDTLEITRDFPHYLDRALRHQLGDSVSVFFFNGAEGDVNIGHKSGLTAVGASSPSRTFAKAEEVGESLAAQVLAGMSRLEAEAPLLSCKTSRIRLPLKSYAPLATMRQAVTDAERGLQQVESASSLDEQPNLDVLEKRCDVLYARIEEFYASAHAQESLKELPTEVATVTLGNTALVAIAGEPFVEMGLAIRKKSPYERTFVLGLANDYIGYIPTIAGAQAGGYEVVAAQVLPTASSLIEKAALELLENRS